MVDATNKHSQKTLPPAGHQLCLPYLSHPINMNRAPPPPPIPPTNSPHQSVAAHLSHCCHQQPSALHRHSKTDGSQREEDAAKWQQRNGIARVERIPRDTQFLPHPSNGGLRGYDIPFCQMMVEAYQVGNPAPYGMLRSIQRWTNCTIPFQMTVNKSISALTGQYLLLLVVFKVIWPQATYIKCIAFIANKSNDARVFSEKDVSKASEKTGLYHEGNVHCCLSGIHRAQF